MAPHPVAERMPGLDGTAAAASRRPKPYEASSKSPSQPSRKRAAFVASELLHAAIQDLLGVPLALGNPTMAASFSCAQVYHAGCGFLATVRGGTATVGARRPPVRGSKAGTLLALRARRR